MLRQTHSHIGDKTCAGLGRVHHRAVAGDDPAPFHILHPAQAGRRLQAHTVGQFQIRDTPLTLQDTQYMFSFVVKVAHGL